MMRTLAQTGNGWMTFKDPSNLRCNQTGAHRRHVHLSNLCTEIIEVTSARRPRVCNLGSINLGKFVVTGEAARRATTSSASARSPAPRCATSTGHRHQLLPDRRGAGLQQPLRPVGSG